MTPLLALLAAAFANQDIDHLPPATPTYSLEGPLDFCAEEFSVRLARGETMKWIAWRNVVRYTIRRGDIEAEVGRERAPAPSPLATTTALRLPLSPVARRYVEAIPDRTEMDAAGNQRDGYDYVVGYLLYGAARTGRPVSVMTQPWGDRHLQLPFVSRIDPRPLAARHCRVTRADPAFARRIGFSPGR